MPLTPRFLSFLGCLCLAGCSQLQGGGLSAEAAKTLQDRVGALEVRLVAAESELANLRENWVSRYELMQQIFGLDLQSRSVVLQPISSGYGVVRNDHGLMAMSFKDAGPIGSGTRLKVGIVNLMAVDMADVSLEVRYTAGGRESLFLSTADGGSSSEIRKTLSESLVGGAETLVTIDLPGISPDKLTFFEITPEVGAMRYR